MATAWLSQAVNPRNSSPGRFRDRLGHGHDRRPGRDAGPLHPDVDLDDDRQDAGAVARSRGQLVQVHEAVDRHDRIGQIQKIHQAAQLDGPHDLIGDQDVADPRLRHDFGLAELGAGDPDGACRQLLADDADRLLAFDMRAPLNAVLAADRGDPGDIGLHHIEIDQQGGRIQRCRGRADRDGGRGHFGADRPGGGAKAAAA